MAPRMWHLKKKIEERRKHQLRRYYEKVISEVGDARKILLFGPGEVKISFEKEMKKSKNLSAKIVSVEPADKMTEKQIVAKVRKFFSPAE
jgi:stalled ribosome rescue protein Dom34